MASRHARWAAGVIAVFIALASAAGTADATNAVLSYHGNLARSGNFVVPGLSWAKARNLRLDPGFHPRFRGHLYAQPLYWQPPGASAGILIVATESDDVYAIDALSGAVRWSRKLGDPVPRSMLACGDIDPLGVTGTPVIDRARRALYLDAAVKTPAGMRHQVFALSLADGAVLKGWPVDIATALAKTGRRFPTRYQGERGALTLLDGRVYIPFGGQFGDCGPYHGWVVGIQLDDPADLVSWETRAEGGGIWAPGGIANDGHSLFVATGNTKGAADWGDGEAVFRLGPALVHSLTKRSFFAPSDWKSLDERDLDMGGSNPLPLGLPQRNGTLPAILALGKDGRAYLLNRRDLGGFGGALATARVASFPIITAPAAFPAADGTFVAFGGRGSDCPTRHMDDSLAVLRIRAGPPASIATVWCGRSSGRAAPIVTTTDGTANPIVWMLGAEGDNRLHGFQGESGAPLYVSPPLEGLRRFQTLIAVGSRLYVGADGRLYSFSL